MPSRSGSACWIMIVSMNWTKTWMDPGFGPPTSRRGRMTLLAIKLCECLARNWGIVMVIRFPSLLRSLWSFLLHLRDPLSSISITSSSYTSLLAGVLLAGVFLRLAWMVRSWRSSWQISFPRLSPDRLVIGVLVINHVLSALSSLAEIIKAVDMASDSLARRSSSMTRRFHRIFKKGDTSSLWQWQMGTLLEGVFSQEQGCQDFNFKLFWGLDSLVNPAKKWELIRYLEAQAYLNMSLKWSMKK